MSSMTCQEVAELVEGTCNGPGDLVVHDVASIDSAEAGTVTFLGNIRYQKFLFGCSATAVLVPADYTVQPPEGRAWINVENPTLSFSKLIDYFIPTSPVPAPGIHKSAVVADSAQIHHSVCIGPNVVVEDHVIVGPNCRIDGGCYVGHGVTIGTGCRLHPNVTICEKSVLGSRVSIQSGTVIGSDGFGFDLSQGGHTKIPQVGFVRIDDDVDIGSNVSIDRARFRHTWIQRGVKIDNLVQIAHNVIVGEDSVIVAQVGIAGSSEIGKGVILAGQAGIPGHVKIGDRAIVRPKSGVFGDIESGADVMGTPAIPHKEFCKQQAVARKTPQMREQLREMLKTLERLENAG